MLITVEARLGYRTARATLDPERQLYGHDAAGKRIALGPRVEVREIHSGLPYAWFAGAWDGDTGRIEAARELENSDPTILARDAALIRELERALKARWDEVRPRARKGAEGMTSR